MPNVIVSGKLDEAKSLEILQEKVQALVEKEWSQSPEFRDLLRLFKEVSIRIVFGENQKVASDALSWSVSDPRLGLSARVRNCLEPEIQTLGQLVQKTEDYLLLNVRNFGVVSLGEIKEKLQELGLKLASESQTRMSEKPD